MRLLSTAQALRRLGLDERADRRRIQQTFRRLAKQLHPDVNPGPAAARRFIAVTEAYRVLLLRVPDRGGRPLACPRCGVAGKPLGSLLDGRQGCADCLLGKTVRKRRLPGPVERLPWPIVALGLYICGGLLLTRFLMNQTGLAAVGGILCLWLGIALLAKPLMQPADSERVTPRASS